MLARPDAAAVAFPPGRAFDCFSAVPGPSAGTPRLVGGRSGPSARPQHRCHRRQRCGSSDTTSCRSTACALPPTARSPHWRGRALRPVPRPTADVEERCRKPPVECRFHTHSPTPTPTGGRTAPPTRHAVQPPAKVWPEVDLRWREKTPNPRAPSNLALARPTPPQKSPTG